MAVSGITPRLVVSYSVFGPDRYWEWAKCSIAQSLLVYPGWYIYVFHDASCHTAAASVLLSSFWGNPWVQFVAMRLPTKTPDHARLWRFLPIEDPRVVAFISRDADSYATMVERYCVDRWLASGRTAHVLHSVPVQKQRAMLAGLFGLRRNTPVFSSLTPVPSIFLTNPSQWGCRTDAPDLDELFLNALWWPTLRGDAIAFGPASDHSFAVVHKCALKEDIPLNLAVPMPPAGIQMATYQWRSDPPWPVRLRDQV